MDGAGTITVNDVNEATSRVCDVIFVITWYDPSLTKMTSIEKSPSTADMFGNGIGASVPPTITTLANRFVTGLPVCKFWTVNLSVDVVPIVGCSGMESEEEGWNIIRETESLEYKIGQIHVSLPFPSSRITSYPSNY
jgi:hypothetical protein